MSGQSPLKNTFPLVCDIWAESFKESDSSCLIVCLLSNSNSGQVNLFRYVCLLLFFFFILYMFVFKHVRWNDVLLCLLARLCVLFFIRKLSFNFVLFYL